MYFHKPKSDRLLADNSVSPAAWFLVGPTAVGKTAVAQYLAERTGAAILSVDAMLVYRSMDIGTAKPSVAEREAVRYFGIDLADPDELFSTGVWLQRLRAQWLASQVQPSVSALTPVVGGGLIAAGGTGLYVRALTQGLDLPAADPVRRAYWQERLAREGLSVLWRELVMRAPQAATALADPENPRRVIRALEHLDNCGTLPVGRTAPRPHLVGLHLPRAALQARIAARVEQMFAAGLIEEVQSLRARFPAWGQVSHTSRGVREAGKASAGDGRHGFQGTKGALCGEKTDLALSPVGAVCTAQQAIGYAEVCALLDNRITREQAIAQIVIRTRQLAKRQETWFRHQAEMTWIEVSPEEPVAAMAERVLTAWREHGPTPIRLS